MSTVAFSAALLSAAPWTAVADEPPSAHATPSCPDAAQIIYEEATIQRVIVGIKKTQQMALDVWADTDCAVTQASATVDAPRRNFVVKLTKIETANGYDHWRGSLSIRPRTLRNSDAGIWPTTYRVNGAGVDQLTVPHEVLRASRLTFNAGPEPVRNHRITDTGKVERATWNTLRYRGWSGRTVPVTAFFDDHDISKQVAVPVTRKDGTYRLARRFPGADEYHAYVPWTPTTAAANSRSDHVN